MIDINLVISFQNISKPLLVDDCRLGGYTTQYIGIITTIMIHCTPIDQPV
jgi:hypothetical protein